MKYGEHVNLNCRTRCEECGFEIDIPGNYCEKCGSALSKDLCVLCWKNNGKTAKKTAYNCSQCTPVVI